MKASYCGIIALSVSAAFGQTAGGRPEFEVASIKPSPPQTPGQVTVGVRVDGAQMHCSMLSLRDYIATAYRLKIYQISGPDWLASEKFDISAKLPEGAERSKVPEMLQALLEQRFQMKAHRDSKEFPVYGLVVAKGGPKLKESDTEGADAAKPVEVTASGGRGGVGVNLGNGSSFSLADNKFEARKLTMLSLADTLGRFVDRPVVDMTDLKGEYDLTLQLTEEDYHAMLVRSAIAAGYPLPPEAIRALEGVTDDSLFTALQAAGLKLEPRKAPLDVLVIDSMLKAPTAN